MGPYFEDIYAHVWVTYRTNFARLVVVLISYVGRGRTLRSGQVPLFECSSSGGPQARMASPHGGVYTAARSVI
jgi:hypothetical protein